MIDPAALVLAYKRVSRVLTEPQAFCFAARTGASGGLMEQVRRWATALLAILLFLPTAGPATAQTGEPAGDCTNPANLTFNCDFNSFTDQSADGQIRQLADGWNLWVEAGSLAVDQAVDSPSP